MTKQRKVVPWPQRLRQIPLQFSWVDHRLVQQGYLDRCEPPAAALYLFLVTVADAQGLSYYGEATLMRRLQLEHAVLIAARRRLIELQLIAYAGPIYQVLAVTAAHVVSPWSMVVSAPPPTAPTATVAATAAIVPPPPAPLTTTTNTTTTQSSSTPAAAPTDRAQVAALLAQLRQKLEPRHGRL